jgi:hypothetical protein
MSAEPFDKLRTALVEARVLWGVRAPRLESAYFVVTRRRESVSARSSSARRRAVPDAHTPSRQAQGATSDD